MVIKMFNYEDWNSMTEQEQDTVILQDLKECETPVNPCIVETFTVTTRIPENYSLSNNGGDYEEWLSFHKVAPGKFMVFSHTSCDFSDCGTGYEGVWSVSAGDYLRMRAEELSL